MKKKLLLIFGIILSLASAIGFSVVVALNPYVFRYYFNNNSFDITSKPIADELTIMSFNIRYKSSEDRYKKSWYYRADLTLRVIEKEKPDIIGFQEAQVIHEKFYKKHLKGYDFKQGYRDKTSHKEGTLIAYRNDVFSKYDEGLFWLSKTPEKESKDWNSDSARVANYVCLKYKDKRFTVLNTHLNHKSYEARVNGANVIINKINELNLNNPILLGDMNSTENSEVYKNITDFGLNDALANAKEKYVGAGATYHGYGEKIDYGRIDYIFLSSAFEINNYHVVDTTFDGVYPSDHFPIVTKACFS